jgi:hypothetical protein
MSRTREDIRNLLRGMAGKSPNISRIATVKAVSGDSCTVMSNGITYYNVRLSAVNDGAQKSLVIPALGSDVIIGFVENSEYDAIVTAYSTIDRIDMQCKVVHNQGAHGGLAKVEQLTARLNAIEKAFNRLLGSFQLHTHGLAPNELAAASGELLSLTIKNDIENTNFTHG